MRRAVFLIALGFALCRSGVALELGGTLPGQVTDQLVPGVTGTAREGLEAARERSRLMRETLDGLRDTVGRPLGPGADTGAIDLYPDGTRAVHAEILATAPAPGAEAIWSAQGLTIARRDTLEPLGLDIVVLRVAEGTPSREALDRLRLADPAGSYDLNHLYDPSGLAILSAAALAPAAVACEGCRIGIIDSGADTGHRALRRARIESRAFAGQEPVPSLHGTAIAALLAGPDGAARHARLFLADVYGGLPQGGSAEAIARGLAWLASEKTPVVTMSLAGPPNTVLEAAIGAMMARGHLIVAAVGNGGPAAPPAYPAAYPGVIGVTAIDAAGKPAFDAQRGPQVGFAAFGVDLAVPQIGGGETTMTGTSFATPRIAARAAALLPKVDPAAAASALAALRAGAVDLGAPGRDDVFGDGALEDLSLTASSSP